MSLEPTVDSLHKVIRGPTVVVSVAIHALMLAIWAGMLLFMAPRFQGMFADLDATLPWISRFVLALAGTVRRWWPLFGLLAVGLLALDAWLMSLIGKKIKFLGALGWNTMMMILLAAGAVVTLMAMYLPIFTAVGAL
jgi:type II secretory pathway component PulF